MDQHLNADCLDRWLGSFEYFRLDFLRQTQILCKAVGFYFEFDQTLLQSAHDKWVAEAAFWRSIHIMPDSNGLSHLKLLAILLVSLAEEAWVKELFEFDSDSEALNFTFAGTPDERDEVRRDIAAGRGIFLAFYFCTQIINWFEAGRDDKLQPFEIRITPDLEHDFLVYLNSDARNAMGTFVAIKALYVRDDKPDAGAASIRPRRIRILGSGDATANLWHFAGRFGKQSQRHRCKRQAIAA